MDLRTIELKISRGENLPILPQVVSAAFKLADDPKCSPIELERLIQQDAALTAKILRVVNSPIFAVGTVTSISRALSVIGTNRVRSQIMSFALQNLASERQQASTFNKLEFWRHSLAVATAARMIARLRRPAQAEEMYVAGLLHDIGLLLMDKFCPDQLDSAIELARSECIPMIEAEPKVMEFTHADLGGFLVRRWGIGDFLAQAVEHHHQPDLTGAVPFSTAILFAADSIAHAAGFTNQVPSVPYELCDETVASLGLTREQVQGVAEQMCADLIETEKAFAICTVPAKRADPPPSDRLARATRLSA